MFFKKKKPKLDAKVRFQHKQFTTKLGSARSYRRTTVAVPESSYQKWLSKIGLGSLWSQILVGAIILAGLYLAYFPNFLSIKEISISGLSQSQAHDLESNIRDQITESKFYTAQNNLLFFDPELVQVAASKLTSVNKIDKIKKNYKTKTIEIFAEAKYEKYLVATPDKVLDVYNDGSFKAESGVSRSNWATTENSSMTKVVLYQDVNVQNGQQFFNENLRDFLSSLSDQLRALETYQLAYYSFKEPEPEVVPVVKPEESSLELRGISTPEERNMDVQSDTAKPNEEQSTQPAQPIEPAPALELKLPFSSSQVNAVFYKGTDKKRLFKVVFDSTKDSQKAVNDLKILLLQTNPDRFNQLSYIDMRIDGKAYICLLNSPCNR